MDYKLPRRFEESNKSTYGRVLNFAGSDYMPGAAYLSSVSALKVGCGYCFLCSTGRVIDAVAAQTQNVVFAPLYKRNEYIAQADVVEIGCGLSQSDDAECIFKSVISQLDPEKPLIIDADGLNLLSKNADMFLDRDFQNVILTPHPKEAARLLGIDVDEILSDLPAYAKAISAGFNAITVLKSHKTFVSTPDGVLYENTTGNNALAKAGSGDVLTGMIAGFVAQDMNLYHAACLAVYLHGLAGDLARDDLTEYSVMASDLIDYIPKAIMQIK
jgi:NAD(P)H-hydrate epimerase